MKKLLLSGFVVLTFIAYSFQQRHEGSNAVTAPTTLTQSGQSAQNSQSTQSNPVQIVTPSSNQQAATAAYKDGSYIGSVADAYYGNIQVQVAIRGGKITGVQFLQYPNDRSNSIRINQVAMPYLKQEAIKAQSSHVNVISGATDTSYAFIQSLSAALSKAQ
jgi:uncharacterized protein with FMN-binding domain